jgi:hypothetical protein
MFIYRGNYKESYHYFRNTSVIREREDEIFDQGEIIRKKWWKPFAPLMDFVVTIGKARGNPFRIFGYPDFMRFSYADFYEYRSRIGEVIYRSLLHYKKMHDTDNAMAVCDYMDGLESAIWSFWFISGAKNPEGKRLDDVYGHSYEHSPEAQARFADGMKWFAENFATLWD